MKYFRILNAALVLAATLPLTSVVSAQSVVISDAGTSTTSLGTISEFSPDTIVIRSETSPEPIRYSYTKTTTYVDETGAPVSMELVKSGLPVTVYYVKEGDRMVANRVVVRRHKSTVTDGAAGQTKTEVRTEAPAAIQEKKSTTTTTTTDGK